MRDKPATVVALPALLVGREAAGRMCGVSGRTFFRLGAQGLIPEPAITIGARKLWRVLDLEEWVEQGCPSLARMQSQTPDVARRPGLVRSDAVNKTANINSGQDNGTARQAANKPLR